MIVVGLAGIIFLYLKRKKEYYLGQEKLINIKEI